jgi:hypothetical protein
MGTTWLMLFADGSGGPRRRAPFEQRRLDLAQELGCLAAKSSLWAKAIFASR